MNKDASNRKVRAIAIARSTGSELATSLSITFVLGLTVLVALRLLSA